MTKQQAQNRLDKQVNMLIQRVDTLCQYVDAFRFLPPQGEGARESAIDEFVTNTSRMIECIKVIRNKQIELINWEVKDD